MTDLNPNQFELPGVKEHAEHEALNTSNAQHNTQMKLWARDPDPHNPSKWDEPRENYPHAEGQTVMGVHDLSTYHHLDRHGNVYQPREQNWYERNTAGKNAQNEAQWAARAKHVTLRADTVLHTGQPADPMGGGTHTGDHSYIHGPMDPKKGAVDILIEKGVPWVADGHHRLAEMRGRGMTEIHARVRNLDEENASMPSLPTPRVKKSGDEMRAHLAEHHNVHPGMFAIPMYHTQNVKARHDVLHRQEFAEHVHE